MTRIPIVAVVGSRQSGKTTAVEALVKGLTRNGHRVATVKHIPEPDFTIDTKGKDTWRHSKAGAIITLSVAPRELALLKKVDTAKLGLAEIARYCENEADVIVLEGFRDLVARNQFVPKVVAVKTIKELKEASEHFEPIIAFVGAISAKPHGLSIGFIDSIQKAERLVEAVEDKINRMTKREKKPGAAIKIELHGKRLPLNLFAQKLMRTVVLSMISTLRDVSIRGDEQVIITIGDRST